TALADGRGIVTGSAQKGPFIPVFTDSDRARRFIAEEGFDGAVPMAFERPRDFILFLEGVQRAGHSRIAYDPQRAGMRVLPIARALQEFRERFPGSEG